MLVARLDFLPEQANPRVHVEPVLPQMTAETAMVVETQARLWKLTTCVRFQVISGRAETFKIDVPESWASTVEVMTIPASRTSSDLPIDGRIALSFHPDEPVGDQPFVVVLTGTAEMAGGNWQLPAVGLPGAEPTTTMVSVPNGILEPADTKLLAESFTVPEWLHAIVPAPWRTARAGRRIAGQAWPKSRRIPRIDARRPLECRHRVCPIRTLAGRGRINRG